METFNIEEDVVTKLKIFKKISKEAEVIADNTIKYVNKHAKSILDIGSGTGFISRHIANQIHKKDCKITFVDPIWNPDGDLQQNESFIQQDWQDFKSKEKFDLILFSHVIVWFPEKDRNKLILKATNFLKENGQIIIIENKPTGKFWKWFQKTCEITENYVWYPSDIKLIDFLKNNSFKVEIYDFKFPLNKINKKHPTKMKDIVDIFFPFEMLEVKNKENAVREEFLQIPEIIESIIVVK